MGADVFLPPDADFAQLALGIIAWVILGTIGGRMFAHRGYPPLIGVAVGVLLGPLWLLLCWFLPMTSGARSEWKNNRDLAAMAASRPCPQCGRVCGGLATFCPQCHHRFALEVGDAER